MVKLESLRPSKRLHAGIKNLEQAFFSTMAAILFHEVIAQHVHADALPRTGWERAARSVGTAPVSPPHLLKFKVEVNATSWGQPMIMALGKLMITRVALIFFVVLALALLWRKSWRTIWGAAGLIATLLALGLSIIVLINMPKPP